MIIIGASASVVPKRAKMTISRVKTSMSENLEKKSKQEASSLIDSSFYSGAKTTLAQVSVAYIPEIAEMRCRTYLVSRIESMKESSTPSKLTLGFTTTLRKILGGKDSVHLKLVENYEIIATQCYSEFWAEVVQDYDKEGGVDINIHSILRLAG